MKQSAHNQNKIKHFQKEKNCIIERWPISSSSSSCLPVGETSSLITNKLHGNTLALCSSPSCFILCRLKHLADVNPTLMNICASCVLSFFVHVKVEAPQSMDSALDLLAHTNQRLSSVRPSLFRSIYSFGRRICRPEKCRWRLIQEDQTRQVQGQCA